MKIESDDLKTITSNQVEGQLEIKSNNKHLVVVMKKNWIQNLKNYLQRILPLQ